VPSGSTSAQFTIRTVSVSRVRTATISATYGVKKSATLTVTP
jgi:hypothetical protein